MYPRKIRDLQLTNSMEQRPSGEVDSRSAGQEIPHLLLNPNVRHCVHKNTSLTQCWATWIQSVPSLPVSVRSNLATSCHQRLGFPRHLFPSGFPSKILYAFLDSSCVLHVILLGLISCHRAPKHRLSGQDDRWIDNRTEFVLSVCFDDVIVLFNDAFSTAYYELGRMVRDQNVCFNGPKQYFRDDTE
jgi:hypothetical protein